MAKASVYNWKKEKVGEVELESAAFEASVRKDLLHTVVKWQLAKRRQGTHATRTRGMVVGSSKKPYKQKGTGNARQGTKKSPLLVGGGITFGPQPRSYEYSLPKKVKKAALRSALSYLVKEGRFHVVEDMKSEDGKTKGFAEKIKSFGVDKAVFIDVNRDEMFSRSIRNYPTCIYQAVEGVNVYDLLKYNQAIITQSSLAQLVARCTVEK
jgi:large subunit ribosomal protein L4